MDDETTSNEQSREPNHDFLKVVNYPEPGIINLEMIRTSYLEEGQRGETRRLHQLEPVVLERIEELRLEFKRKFKKIWILIPQKLYSKIFPQLQISYA